MQLILVFILLMAGRSFLSFFFKADTSALYCGIFGFNGANAPNLAKIKILGLYNLQRGKHSCGIYINNEIIKGVDKLAMFDAFIQSTILPEPETNYNIIAHTRQATIGLHTEDNAHPFRVNDIVGVHNGVIKNWFDLSTKYKVDTAKATVDSHKLYMLIEKEGLKILEEYKGKAALVWAKSDEPNAMFLYHGSSKEYYSGQPVEERPLFFMETAEGVYFSSLESSLLAIRSHEDESPKMLEHNTVFKLVNGKFTSWRKRIAREDANVDFYPPATTKNHNCSVGNSHRVSSPDVTMAAYGTGTNSRLRDFRSGTPNSGWNKNAIQELPFDEALILRESLPLKATSKDADNFVFFHRGRYWINVKKLCHGMMHLKDKGERSTNLDKQAKAYYFWEGVMLTSAQAFNQLVVIKSKGSSWLDDPHLNFALKVSEYSKFPTCNLPHQGSAASPSFRFRWYENCKHATSFTPKFSSGRSYKIEDGILKEISSSSGEKTVYATIGIADDKISEARGDAPKVGFSSFVTPDGAGECCEITPPLANGSIKGLSVVRGNLQSGDESLHSERPPFKGGVSIRAKNHPSATDPRPFFDKVFYNMRELGDAQRIQDTRALRKYIADNWKEIFQIEFGPSEDEVTNEITRIFRDAIANGTTVRSEMEGKVARLDYYFQLECEDLGLEVAEDDSVLAPESTIVIDSYTEIVPQDEELYEDEPPVYDDVEDVEHTIIVSQDNKASKYAEQLESALEAQAKEMEKRAQQEEFDKEQAMMHVDAAATTIEHIVSSMEEIEYGADELQANESDLAQEAANACYRFINNMKYALADAADKHGQANLKTTINNLLTSAK